MLPSAAIRLKQGFGRLIRSTGDHGVVLVLDGRVAKKSYGRYFIDSLPRRRW
jgi:ATP-dependent DNA helicase DinG